MTILLSFTEYKIFVLVLLLHLMMSLLLASSSVSSVSVTSVTYFVSCYCRLCCSVLVLPLSI